MSSNAEKIEEKTVNIVLERGFELPDKSVEIENKINQIFKEGKYNIAINMKNIKLAPTAFIVTLIKVTCQARRMGGDIKLININPFTKNGFVTFTPNTFLTLEQSEDFALSDFGETLEVGLSFDKKAITSESKGKKESIAIKEIKENNVNDNITAELQTLPLNDSNKIRVDSSPKSLYQVCDFVLERAKKAGFDEHELAKIKVTVYEAGLNAIEHSYFSNPDYWIDVYAVEQNRKFYILIHDWGRSFEFDPDRNYDVEMAVKQRKTGGFGLHIIKRTVDEMYYLNDKKVGNRLILIKNINSQWEDGKE